MIQIYKNTNTNYEFNGDMFLLPSSCTVKRKLGADFSLTMKNFTHRLYIQVRGDNLRIHQY